MNNRFYFGSSLFIVICSLAGCERDLRISAQPSALPDMPNRTIPAAPRPAPEPVPTPSPTANVVPVLPPGAVLNFTTMSQSVKFGGCSAVVTAQISVQPQIGGPQGSGGPLPMGPQGSGIGSILPIAPFSANEKITVNLSGSGVSFFSDPNCAQPVSSVAIPVNGNEASFYFKGANLGFANIVAETVTTPLINGTQAEKIFEDFSNIPESHRVLIAYNADNTDSIDVANYYADRRGIPASHKCGLTMGPRTDTVPWDNPWGSFEALFRIPLQNCINALGSNGKQKILYIVFTYKVPYAFYPYPAGAGGAIDHHVSDLWNEIPGSPNTVFNPYFRNANSKLNVYGSFVSLSDYRNTFHGKTLYSVMRLDGATPALAKGLVDKAMQAEATGLSGIGCFDRRFGADMNVLPDSGYQAGDWDIHQASVITESAGFSTLVDYHAWEIGSSSGPGSIARCDNTALYAGWYRLGRYNDFFTWNTGAIGFHLDSASAQNPRAGPNWSANAIQKGITVTSGAVGEPYLEGMVRVDGFFRNIFEGANVGDAMLRNLDQVRWMIISMGDPLYRPFPGGRGVFAQ